MGSLRFGSPIRDLRSDKHQWLAFKGNRRSTRPEVKPFCLKAGLDLRKLRMNLLLDLVLARRHIELVLSGEPTVQRPAAKPRGNQSTRVDYSAVGVSQRPQDGPIPMSQIDMGNGMASR